MNRLSIISDSQFESDRIRRKLAGTLDVRVVGFQDVRGTTPDRFNLVIVNLHDPAHVLDLKEWSKSTPKSGKVVFAIRAGSHAEMTQALALGATDVIDRPIDTGTLLKVLWRDVASLAGGASGLPGSHGRGIAAAQAGLQTVFASACLGEPLHPASVGVAGTAIANEIESKGLWSWVDTVRKHHSQTYQHCLLVTGVAVAFAQHLGLSASDRGRLSFAGMLHDIGKARIPLEILEKPGPLDQDELTIMRKHPEYGLEALKASPGLQPEMIDMVVHHHELLDGSGYPHGLGNGEISDLVRMITISDVFGALIERRSYKPPLTSQKAYEILLNMGPKLDKDLVREFGSVVPAAQAA